MTSENQVSLFATCMIDLFAPTIAESTVHVLEHLGYQVDFPPDQTCCGQPAANAGYVEDSAAVAKQFVRAFVDSSLIVTPSGSCAAFLRHRVPELLEDQPQWHQRALETVERVHEFSEFLVNVAGVTDIGAHLNTRVTYHTSCHMSRGLGIREAPVKLLKAVQGLEYVELGDAHQCCGFGGTFSIKMPDLAREIADDKIAQVMNGGADVLVSADPGCLMHLRGRMKKRGLAIEVKHIAELLDAGLSQGGAA